MFESTFQKIKRRTLGNFISGRLMKNKADFHFNKIDKEKFEEIKNKYVKNEHLGQKYLNIRKYFHNYLFGAHHMELHKSTTKKILDIGTGAGYFPFICNNYGHNAIGTDMDTNPIYNEMIALLNVKRYPYLLHPSESYNHFETRFDVIAAFNTVFDMFHHDQAKVWNVEEWDFLLHDFKENLLEEDGLLYFKINDSHYTPAQVKELKKIFIKYQADFNYRAVQIKAYNIIK